MAGGSYTVHDFVNIMQMLAYFIAKWINKKI